jgi:hypothetical protein
MQMQLAAGLWRVSRGLNMSREELELDLIRIGGQVD